MGLLDAIDSPADLKAMRASQLPALAGEIRAFLVDRVSRTGGHLGPNLGVVELTIALHRVFDSPQDVLLWDTGHQAYVHKILTGRRDAFDGLRQAGGLSGYPSRAESVHDVIENSHASTALAYADGIARGFERAGSLGSRHVVAVVGDGALTGGMAWEALNNIADSERQVIVVVNDNSRSYSPTIGGLARHLDSLRSSGGYERFLDWGRGVLDRTPVLGGPIFDALHGMKKGVKDMVAPQGMFEDLGMKYLGPVDGHDIAATEAALRAARGFPGPVLVHVITQKGRGYEHAENDDADRFHGVAVMDPDTGIPVSEPGATWTAAFAEELVAIGAERPDVVGITAAMAGPTGLDRFAAAHPDRMFDVGIAEQHAAACAAGMAFAGLHPVVALYSTFLNRAFDQVLMDVALHRAAVTFVLDRAGITGDDGASHNGMWDISLMGLVPGIHIAAPRDETTLRLALRAAVGHIGGPSVVRFPKGRLPELLPAIRRSGPVDILHEDPAAQVLLVGVGPMAHVVMASVPLLAKAKLPVVVAAPTWIHPVPAELVSLAGRIGRFVTIEDGGVVGGFGDALRAAVADAGLELPSRRLGIPQEFLAHATRGAILEEIGLTPAGCAGAAAALVASAGLSSRQGPTAIATAS